ncbi:PE family protein [Mycobacterium spongiae]|uniref:PE domain-containing protein n=1 Tax=Mycobacterium spongiae TaxID=886343 RepID=A0A975JXC3_9MYCO|nr:PE family protein [Mycobacterium spongiae]QUR67426.1 PE domain-containing protein [Mycobacterium spongiae]
MSFLSVVPDTVAAAAGELESLGSAILAANGAAATPTTGLAAMASDEVSTALTAAFATHAQQYQAFSAEAAAFHEQFVRMLNGGAAAYVGAEAANAQQAVLNAVNAPTQALLGHPLVGTGPAGAAAAMAEEITPNTQNFNIPLGPFQVSASFTGPFFGENSLFISANAAATLTTPFGPVALLAGSGTANLGIDGSVFIGANGTSPLGPLGASLTGNSVSIPDGQAIQFTGGTLNLPSAIPLLAAPAGPFVTGGASLLNSGGTFVTALGGGDVLGAANTAFGAPVNFADAVLFGQTPVTVPDTSLASALGLTSAVPQVHIPFGGVFAPLEPLSVTVPPVGEGTGAVLGSQFPLQGTQFGGLVPVLMKTLGLPL